MFLILESPYISISNYYIEIETFFIDYFDPIHLFLLIFKTMKNIR